MHLSKIAAEGAFLRLYINKCQCHNVTNIHAESESYQPNSDHLNKKQAI
jgi:hypothetical protein